MIRHEIILNIISNYSGLASILAKQGAAPDAEKATRR
jgi:hypothetical protein